MKETQTFNSKTTGMSFYDNMLNNAEYFESAKGLVFEIVQMTPQGYLKACREGFESNENVGIEGELCKEYANLMRNGTEFPMLMLDYSKGFEQEGRNRALAAFIADIELVPVMIIKKKD